MAAFYLFRTCGVELRVLRDDVGPMAQRLGHSMTYRMAVGPRAGRKVFTLQTLPAYAAGEPRGDTVGKVAGFSLYAAKYRRGRRGPMNAASWNG